MRWHHSSDERIIEQGRREDAKEEKEKKEKL
jgi:hypothetical protein